MDGSDGSGAGEQTRWPRRRILDPRRRWDPDRPSQDIPTIASTVMLTLLGFAALAGLAWLSLPAAGIVYCLLLVWSIAVDVTGNTVTSRIRGLPHRILWVVVRPAYAVGLAIWAVVELLLDFA